jgi:hypothetical protein
MLMTGTGDVKKPRDKYQEECERYLEEYQTYVIQSYCYELMLARRRSLSFQVSNHGKVPAENITVLIKFPTEFNFMIDEETIEFRMIADDHPVRPKRPSTTVSTGDLFRNMMNSFSSDISDFTVPISDTPMLDEREPMIAPKDDCLEIRYELSELMHGFDISLNPVSFLVTLQAVQPVWEIGYAIHAANLRERIMGTLLLEIEEG